MSKIKLSENFIKDRVKLALTEDLYPYGDITSNLINDNKIIQAKIISNQKERWLKDKKRFFSCFNKGKCKKYINS